jgi:hypothetical protein
MAGLRRKEARRRQISLWVASSFASEQMAGAENI